MVAAVRVLFRVASVIEEACRKNAAPTRDVTFSAAGIIPEQGIRVEIRAMVPWKTILHEVVEWWKRMLLLDFKSEWW